MTLNVICSDCARTLGVNPSDDLLNEEPFHQDLAQHCDNCGVRRMLRSMEDFGLADEYLTGEHALYSGKELARIRLTHRAMFVRNDADHVVIKVLGPQPKDRWQDLLALQARQHYIPGS